MTKSNTIHRTQELFRRREAKEKLELENAFYGHGISFLLRLPD